MKQILPCLLLCFLFCCTNAQEAQRHITFNTIDRDSISLPLNDGYYLIEDSCAQILRNCRFDFNKKKFYGKFTDVSKANPTLIVSQGTYSSDGLKNGLFVTYRLNGNIEAKGNFKDDKYDGHWEMFYENGKPELTFDIVNGEYNITDAWKPDGTKIVDKGTGTYKSVAGNIYWTGKLINGKPNGTWKLISTDDISNTPILTENFKKGLFVEGSNGSLSYTDASHVFFVAPDKLPFVNAEKMLISAVACDGNSKKHAYVVGAQYKDGLGVFSTYISDAVSRYLSHTELRSVSQPIIINGEVGENGAVINLKYDNAYKEDIARGLVRCLKNLPALHPATADGVPIKQKFSITFSFYNGMYRFSYIFLPIQIN